MTRSTGWLCGALVLLLAAAGHAALGHQRGTVLTGTVPGTVLAVTVAEGPAEPRSIGSYAVRVYEVRDNTFPYDVFVAGLVRKRNGGVEELRFADVDGNGRLEAVVVIRSAGSGGYVSADAFSVTRNGIRLFGAVEDLNADVDPIEALRGSRGR